MAGIKFIHYSKVCETTREMTKHLSTCESTIRCIISRQTRHQVLVTPKAEATVLLTEQILGQI